MNSLHGLFLKEINEIYVMENKIAEALPKMASAAKDEKLKAGFEEHLEQTRNQVSRLETIIEGLNEKFEKVENPVIDALIAKSEEIMSAEGDKDVKDAALIEAAQEVEHFEMACYGAAIAWAKIMKHDDAADLLHDTLEEEKATDKKLSGLAEGGVLAKGINEEAHD